jgi:hypothetical protein
MRLKLQVDSDRSSQIFHCNIKEWYYLMFVKETNSVQIAAFTGDKKEYIRWSIPKSIFDKVFSSVNSSSLGIYIKKKMEMLGYSQHELAFRSGLTQMAISKIIRGVTKYLNQESLSKLATGLGVPENELKTIISK